MLSDILMRGMSGPEMIPHVRAKSPDTVVMVSGMQTIESAVGAMRGGAFDYVIKPFNLAKVEAAVSRALEHHDPRVAKPRYENHLEELVRQRTAELDGALQSLEDAYRSTLKALTAALDKSDAETAGHSGHAVNFSLRLGRELRLDAEQMCPLEFGSLLHDIGKIGVPDAVLRKPSRLTGEEREEMRQHPWHVQKTTRHRVPGGAARVVAQHHERFDGTGYPLGLRGTRPRARLRVEPRARPGVEPRG